MPLPRAVNNAHPAATDLFENLIVADAPIGVTNIKLSQQVIECFLIRWSYIGRGIIAPIPADPRGQKTA
jgi:hypothetical protein